MGVEVALAFLASAASFALVAVTVVATGSDLLIALLAALYVVAIAVSFRFAGVAYGIPVTVAVLIAIDWYWVPPTHPPNFPDAGNLADLLAYLAGGVLIGELAARAGRRAHTSESARSELGEEQAALRRVATLVAHGEPPDAVFAVVAKEAGVMLNVDGARVVRFIGEDEILQLEGWTAAGLEPLPVGPLKLENTSLATEVMRTGRAVRIEDYASVNRVVPWFIQQLGIRSGVAAPIVVDGRLWGAVLAWSLEPRLLPADAERRLVAFTELVGMAISNTASREELALLAREQEALRRVATLVAGGASPPEVFEAVSHEVGLLLGVTQTHLARFEAESTATGVGSWHSDGFQAPVNTRVTLDDAGVAALVRKSGRPARVDNYDDVSAQGAADARRLGIRSAVGAPIVVDGHLWGVMMAASGDPEQLGPSAESKMAAFTELVATAISNAEARVELGQLANEQSALRRVATLVARGVSPPDLFQAVSQEVGLLLDVDGTYMGRYDNDDTSIGVGSWSRVGGHLPVGIRAALDGTSVTTRVFRTGRPARIDDYDQASGQVAGIMQPLGIRSAVGAPIVIDGRPWGVMIASSNGDEPLRPDTESRIAAFTELVATAISNSEARVELGRLAGEQAALRRVATLVARELPSTEVFAEVAREVGLLLHTESAWMHRYEPDGDATVVASWGPGGSDLPAGTRFSLDGDSVVAIVRRTGRTARIDDYSRATGETGDIARKLGLRSAVGSPIVVGGRLWGALTAVSVWAEPLPADAESHIDEFTELVATAISNLQARSELAASRARIVAAADEERRRVVRDLHDGAQQRLVHTVVTLKLARRALENDGGGALALVTEALKHAEEATAELRELAHGILPSVLTRGGLRAGVVALASRMPVPVDIGISVERFPSAVEATAYFIVAEALTNVAKHAHARHARVTTLVTDGALQVQVRDDGVGGARPDGGGLLGLSDRLGVLDGSLRVDSPRDGGTLIAADIPIR
jgi:GAF domain-containing protein